MLTVWLLYEKTHRNKAINNSVHPAFSKPFFFSTGNDYHFTIILYLQDYHANYWDVKKDHRLHYKTAVHSLERIKN